MANPARKRRENVPGRFFVDDTCIDCDACRWIAPEVFRESGDQSAVYHQPEDAEERRRALHAAVACPTASIGVGDGNAGLRKAQRDFPLLVEDNVFYCGFHSRKSFGAASYFIQRPEGNVLVDSPRFAPPLVRRLEELGGVKYLVLTHADDVADHREFRAHFNCDRLLHEADVAAGTSDAEIILKGAQAWPLASDLLAVPVPGHTEGHVVLLYKNKFLFTGDHLAFSPRRGHLIAFRDACWYSWSEQIASMRKLSNYSFEWVLPGHGRRYRADRSTMAKQLSICIDWMGARAPAAEV